MDKNDAGPKIWTKNLESPLCLKLQTFMNHDFSKKPLAIYCVSNFQELQY